MEQQILENVNASKQTHVARVKNECHVVVRPAILSRLNDKLFEQFIIVRNR